MEKIQLCLLDCSSIQRYVFGSNKLKTNIGASYIVQNIYDECIPKTMVEMEYGNYDECLMRYKSWRDEEKIGVIELANNSKLNWEVGYVGGGNALMLFADHRAKEFIQKWTRNLLLYAPGVKPATAYFEDGIIEFNDEKKRYDISSQSIIKVFNRLNKNKNSFQPETNIMPHGITAECPNSGLSLDVYDELTKSWVSSVVKTKIDSIKPENQFIKKEFKNALIAKIDNVEIEYQFSDDSEKLGQSPQQASHIGIVHIDGNSLGQAFKNCPGLIERRKLSKRVADAVHQSMEITLQTLIKKMPALKKILYFENPDDHLLPFRPIIVNGDDITFICDARVSFFLAEVFMEAIADQKAVIYDKTGKSREQNLSSCAGIAIVKTKYPFYRGYMLAEELCGNAKKKARENPGTSWLDFHISYRGLSGSLEDMRKRQYQVGAASLLWRPWQFTTDQNKNSFNQLKQALKYLLDDKNEKTKWPRSKWHELLNVLTQGKSQTEEFIKLMKDRDLYLPKMKQIPADSTGWFGDKTPYFDILELMDFYPECLLKEEAL